MRIKMQQRHPRGTKKTRVPNLSMKTLGCVMVLERGQESRPLCRIWGKARGILTGRDTRRGDGFTVLLGVFEGMSLQNAEPRVISSTRVYLPGGIHEVIEAETRALPPDHCVSFGFDLQMAKAANQYGYEIRARPLFPRATVHDLAEMRQRITPPPPAPAPATK